MNIETCSYPHPVLGLNDDILGDFSLNLDVERDNTKRTIVFFIKNIVINNTYFQSLISDNKACLLLKIYCSSTFKTWNFRNPDSSFEIHEDDLFNKVEIETFIICEKDIDNYYDSTFNEIFEHQTFKIKKGEIIGVLGKISIPISKEYEMLGLGNIFNFEADNSENPISINLNSDKIIIKYPITITGDHPPSALFNKAPYTAYNIFIIPALIEAFRTIANNNEQNNVEGYEWYYVLNQLLPFEERLDDPFANAQLILNKEIPMLKAFEELCNKN